MKKVIVLLLAVCITGLKVSAQDRVSLNVNDLSKQIEKYIKNHYETHQTVEAYKYNTVYLMGIQQGDSTIELVFDHDGKFMYTKPADFKERVGLQSKTTMSLNDVDKQITKFIKKSYEGFTLRSALKYDIVYTVRVAKGDEKLWLLFNSKGDFMELLDN